MLKINKEIHKGTHINFKLEWDGPLVLTIKNRKEKDMIF